MDGWFKNPEVLFNPLTAQLYDLFAWPFVYATTTKIAEKIKASRSTVLEIGCGTGLVASRLAEFSEKVVGVEPSRYMLQKAAARVKAQGLEDRVQLLSDRTEKLPVGSKEFDVVILSYVLRHIRPESLSSVMTEVIRVIKPNGKFMIADLHLPLTGAFPGGIGRENPNYLILGPLAIYDPASLARYLENYDFKLESLDYYPMSFLLALERR